MYFTRKSDDSDSDNELILFFLVFFFILFSSQVDYIVVTDATELWFCLNNAFSVWDVYDARSFSSPQSFASHQIFREKITIIIVFCWLKRIEIKQKMKAPPTWYAYDLVLWLMLCATIIITIKHVARYRNCEKLN